MLGKRKREAFTPIEIPVEQNTDDWKKQRRIVTASSMGDRTGCSKDSSPELEWDWVINHPGEEKPDPEEYMVEGHVEEDFVAERAVLLLFPRPGMLLPMRKCGIFLLPGCEDWLSASPDRIITGLGPADPFTCLEIKYSRHLLRDHPKATHLIQTVVQMRCTGTDFAFLCYGHMRDCTALFLVQYSPELWHWLLPRARIFRDHVWGRKPLSPNDIPWLGPAVDSYWSQKRIRPAWVVERYGREARKLSFWPPCPRWSLLNYSYNPERIGDYSRIVEVHSPAGPVSPEIFRRAVGVLWQRVGVRVQFTELHSRNQDVLYWQAALDDARLRVRELEQEQQQQQPDEAAGEALANARQDLDWVETVVGLQGGPVGIEHDYQYRMQDGWLQPFAKAYFQARSLPADLIEVLDEHQAGELGEEFASWMRTAMPCTARLFDKQDPSAYQAITRELAEGGVLE
jgi:hypothetical protein